MGQRMMRTIEQDRLLAKALSLPISSDRKRFHAGHANFRFDGTFRNCYNVTLGRDCAARDKADMVHFMLDKE